MINIVVLIGINHDPGLDDVVIPEVKAKIKQYGGKGKKLALETYPGNKSDYWGDYEKYAKSLGTQVVPIDSWFARKHTEAFLKEKSSGAYMSPLDAGRLAQEGRLEEVQREQRIRDGKYEYIITLLRDRYMIKRIQKENPDFIIVGFAHDVAIRDAIEIQEHMRIGEDATSLEIDEKTKRNVEEMLRERNKEKKRKLKKPSEKALVDT